MVYDPLKLLCSPAAMIEHHVQWRSQGRTVARAPVQLLINFHTFLFALLSKAKLTLMVQPVLVYGTACFRYTIDLLSLTEVIMNLWLHLRETSFRHQQQKQ